MTFVACSCSRTNSITRDCNYDWKFEAQSACDWFHRFSSLWEHPRRYLSRWVLFISMASMILSRWDLSIHELGITKCSLYYFGWDFVSFPENCNATKILVYFLRMNTCLPLFFSWRNLFPCERPRQNQRPFLKNKYRRDLLTPPVYFSLTLSQTTHLFNFEF